MRSKMQKEKISIVEGGVNMKRKIVNLCKGMLAIGLMGACCVSLVGGTGAAENGGEPKTTLAPGMEDIDLELYINKKPSDEEIQAAADLREVVQSWIEDGTYPDMFESCHFYGYYQERVVIVLTDVSEETKQKFVEMTGVTPSQHWHFHKGQYSRKELIAVKNALEQDYGEDERIFVGVGDDKICSISLDAALLCHDPGGSPNYDIDQYLSNASRDWGTTVGVACEDDDEVFSNLEMELKQKYGNAVMVYHFGFPAIEYAQVTSAPARASGDVNLDGVTDMSDAKLALRAALGLEQLSDEAVKNGDINGTGKIEVEDAKAILRTALSLT